MTTTPTHTPPAAGRGLPEVPHEPTWEERLRRIAIVVARLGLGYLFFTQLFWKLPPTFGCPPDFAFTSAAPNGALQRTSGLCDWIGVESVWASRPRSILVADLPGFRIGLPIGWAAALNGAFIDAVVKPNIRWFGYLIVLSEAFIAVSMLLGLLTRLGGLVAMAMSAQLVVGLAGISDPFEWEWGYNQMLLLSLLMFALTPGRIFGLDARLRPRLARAAEAGHRLARLGLALT